MYFNTQSMRSSFNEFLVLVSQLPMDIITMSEAWLRDNPALLDYVTLPGYTSVFRNREGVKGGGVGAYSIDSIKFKRRKDIEQLQSEMERLWIEVPGRNFHSKAPIGVIYRSERVGLVSSRLAGSVGDIVSSPYYFMGRITPVNWLYEHRHVDSLGLIYKEVSVCT